jgi:hypothetical protein
VHQPFEDVAQIAPVAARDEHRAGLLRQPAASGQERISALATKWLGCRLCTTKISSHDT